MDSGSKYDYNPKRCVREGWERVSDSAWDVEERMEATAESREDERRRGGIGVRLNVPEGEKERIE